MMGENKVATKNPCEMLQNLLNQPSFFDVSGGCGYDMSHGENPCMSSTGIWFRFCPFCGKEIKNKFTGTRWIWWEESLKWDVLIDA